MGFICYIFKTAMPLGNKAILSLKQYCIHYYVVLSNIMCHCGILFTLCFTMEPCSCLLSVWYCIVGMIIHSIATISSTWFVDISLFDLVQWLSNKLDICITTPEKYLRPFTAYTYIHKCDQIWKKGLMHASDSVTLKRHDFICK